MFLRIKFIFADLLNINTFKYNKNISFTKFFSPKIKTLLQNYFINILIIFLIYFGNKFLSKTI